MYNFIFYLLLIYLAREIAKIEIKMFQAWDAKQINKIDEN